MSMSMKNKLKCMVFGLILLILLGCTPTTNEQGKKAAPQKSVSELIAETHDLELEMILEFKDFDTAYASFIEQNEFSGREQYNTIESYFLKANKTSERARQTFDSLLSKISETKQRDLSANQKNYITKLDQATTNYQATMDARKKHMEEELKLAYYFAHNDNFFDEYHKILVALGSIATFSPDNEEAINEALQDIEDAIYAADGEYNLFIQGLSFPSFVKYEEFLVFAKEYITLLKELNSKEQAGLTLAPAELKKLESLSAKTFSIFTTDQDGVSWVEGEQDDLEAYRRANLYPHSDDGKSFLVKADTYYNEAKLMYEQILRSEATTPSAQT